MRVLVLSSTFPSTSEPIRGVFIRERVRRLARRCEVVVVAPVPWFPFNRWIRGGRALIPRVELQGALTVYHPRFFSLPRYGKFLDGALYFLSLVPFVARLRKTFPFEVIDAHFAYPDGVAATLLARLFRRPVVVTLRGSIVRLRGYRLHRPQLRWVLRRADRIVAVSDALRQVAIDLGLGADRIRVIPNGVDAAAFVPMDRAEARRLCGLPEAGPILLTVAGIYEGKGQLDVIESLPGLIRIFPGLLYVMVGSPRPGERYLRRLKERVLRLGLEGRVRFTGTRPHDELRRWFSAADVSVLATQSEGWPNVLLESLACGTPVVATDVGGVPEIVRDETDGLLVPIGRPGALGATLLQALERSWSRQALAAHAHEFNWEDTVEQALDELAGARRPERPRMIAKLRRKRLHRPEALRLLLKDALGVRHRRFAVRRHVHEAAEWLLRAQQATPDHGVSGAYTFEDGWVASYPETTGYIVPTLLGVAEYMGDPRYRDAALAMAEWERTVQYPEGGFPGHFVDRPNPPVVFNTGQVIFGLLAAHEAAGNAYFLASARQAGDWLLSQQDPDGAWRRSDYHGHVHTYNTRTAWALVELGLRTGIERYVHAGELNLDWALGQQDPNGWFRDCAFAPGRDPYLHTIAYAAQGLLEAGLRLDRANYVAAARQTCEAVLARVRKDGWIPATFDARWNPTARYSCLTGNAQMAALWFRLSALTGEPAFEEGARKANRFLRSLQDCETAHPAVRGAVKGSHPIWGRYLFGTFPNWAAKFFIDALLMEDAFLNGTKPCIRGW